MKYKIRKLLTYVIQSLRFMLYKFKGYDIHFSTEMERGLNLDRLCPKGIHIGKNTIVASRTTILSHKLTMNKESYPYIQVDTYIGDNCLIGVGATILPGVKIGNNCVIGAGSVVTKNVPDNTIAGGNPAKILKENFLWSKDLYL
ncbi:acyltransferase [Saccharicrinis sp. FJH2]|uniref:acyltransferase n=1 Tax=Saccharicrinis sp. FJH65 TaxID=3344659 RepID=UPI0035F2CDF5